MIDETQWIELRRAANQLHICTRQLFTYRRRFEMRSMKVGRIVYVHVDDVAEVSEIMDPCGRPRDFLRHRVSEGHREWMLTNIELIIDDCNARLACYDGELNYAPAGGWDRPRLRKTRNKLVRWASAVGDATDYFDLVFRMVARDGVAETDRLVDMAYFVKDDLRRYYEEAAIDTDSRV